MLCEGSAKRLFDQLLIALIEIDIARRQKQSCQCFDDLAGRARYCFIIIAISVQDDVISVQRRQAIITGTIAMAVIERLLSFNASSI